MLRIRWVPCLVLLVFLVRFATSQEKALETPYYPLQVGNTWHYRITDARGGEGKFSLKVVGTEKVGDVLCARLEMTSESKAASFEHLATTTDGVYRFSISGNRLDKPIRILMLPPKAGATWMVDSKTKDEVLKGTFKLGEEKGVKVLAGTYDTLTVASDDLDANGLKIVSLSQYASGVGLIRQRIQAANQVAVIELEKFEPAKK